VLTFLLCLGHRAPSPSDRHKKRNLLSFFSPFSRQLSHAAGNFPPFALPSPPFPTQKGHQVGCLPPKRVQRGLLPRRGSPFFEWVWSSVRPLSPPEEQPCLFGGPIPLSRVTTGPPPSPRLCFPRLPSFLSFFNSHQILSFFSHWTSTPGRGGLRGGQTLPPFFP